MAELERERPTGLKTVLHIMLADKRNYYPIADGLPQVPGGSAAKPVTF